MAGKKYGVVIEASVAGAFHALPKSEQDIPGAIFGELSQKYAGKVDVLRRYWTGAFNADVTDVFVLEFDDPADYHAFHQELTSRMAESGDPDRFGLTVATYFGVNPDAG